MYEYLRSNKAEALTITGMFLLFAGVLAGSTTLGYDSGLFPRIIGVAGLVVMGAVAWRFAKGESELVVDDELLTTEPRKRLVALTSPPIYGIMFYVIGFYVSAGIAIAAVPWMLGYRKPLRLLLLALGTITALSVMFSTVLNIPIPHGVIGEWLMRRYVYLD